MAFQDTFFEQLVRPDVTWETPAYPAINDPRWHTLFKTASDQGKRNLARAWLWRAQQDNETAVGPKQPITALVNTHYRWLAAIHPYLSFDTRTDTQTTGKFDGSVDSLLAQAALEHAVNNKRQGMTQFAELLNSLWFGTETTRSAALLAFAHLEMDYASQRAQFPRLDNLVQNLAWDLVQEQHLPEVYQAAAAQLSLHAGMNWAPVPARHGHQVNMAWHVLGTHLAMGNIVQVEHYSLDNVFKLITSGSALVAATNMPTLLAYASRGVDEHGVYKIGKTSFLALPFSQNKEANGYEILRAWIPSQVETWEMAQALGLSDTDACRLVQRTLLAPHDNSVTLPDDVVTLHNDVGDVGAQATWS